MSASNLSSCFLLLIWATACTGREVQVHWSKLGARNFATAATASSAENNTSTSAPKTSGKCYPVHATERWPLDTYD